MNPRFIDYSHLAPGLHYERRPASERRSSASFTDGMSNMRRELSSSSHVTESSETTNYIHSNIGDSISSPNPVTPAYVQYDSGAFFWSNGQIQVEDDNTFISDDHSLLPPATQLPQLTLSAENDLLNVESGVNDPDALFEFIINRLRQQYRAQSDRLSYARNLARIYLGVDSIHSFLPSRERSSRPPKPRSQPRSNAQNSQKKEHYLCLLCDSPLHLCSRGAFKRHVNEMHQSKSLFLCMHCTWHNPRKDKLRDHIRVNHGGHTVQELNDRELMLDPPSSCDLCESYESPIHKPPFPSWQAWFEGIEMHCRVEDYEEKPGTGSNPPDQNGGDAGGASGGYFPSAPFFQGPNAGGPSLGQGSNWTSGASFSQWASNIHTRSVSQPSNPSLIERPSISKGVPCGELAPNQKQCASKRCHIRHRKGASVSSSIELGDSRTETLSKKDLPPKTDSALAKLSNKISLLRLDYKRKDIPRLSSAQAPLCIQNDLHAGEKMISGKFYLSEVS